MSPSYDWIVRDWASAMRDGSKAVWLELWFELLGARRLAAELDLHEVWDELTTLSDLADAHIRDCRK